MKNIEGTLSTFSQPYCCVFKYARAVEEKVWNEAENRERDWGLSRACEARELRARKTRTPRFTDFFTDFEKKTIVLQSNHEKAFQSSLNRLKIGFVGPSRGYLHDRESQCLQI